MSDLVVASSDELAHVTLYQWLVETRQTEALLAINSPHLETFLTNGPGKGRSEIKDHGDNTINIFSDILYSKF